MHTISHEHPSVGVGTMDFITEVLDIHAVLDRDRKESLVDCSGQLAEEHGTVAIR